MAPPYRPAMGLLWMIAAFAGPATATQPATSEATPVAAATQVSDAMALDGFVRSVLKLNRTVTTRRSEQALADTAVERARGAFQTQATVTTSAGRSQQASTAEESVTRGQGVYERESTDLSATVSRLLASGTKVEGKLTVSRFDTSAPLSRGAEFRTFYGVTVTHPLARDGGYDVTMARVEVARIEAQGAKAAVLDTEGSVAAEAVFAYWDLVLAQHRAEMTQDKVRMGERLLAQAQSLSRQGRMPESQVWDVESDLIRYRAAVSEARVARAEAVARVAGLLGRAVEAPGPGIAAIDPLVVEPRATPGAADALRRARESRADLRQRQAALDREQIQLNYALNQSRPKVDVVASYGFNGGPSRTQAFNPDLLRNYPSWSVGLQMAMPLGENVQARADIQAARLRVEEAQRQLTALDAAIANDIATGSTMMSAAAERWSLWREVAQREERQVTLERQKLEAGRADLREVLFREERAIDARMAVVEQQVAWSKADALVEAAQGTLLARFP